MKPKNLVIVRAVREQGLSHAEAAARFGVTRQWVHTLVRRYDTEGPDGVAPRSRAPKSRPGTTPDLVRDRIIALRRELTAQGADAGPVTIAWHLEQDGTRAPSTATIRRILHDASLITRHPISGRAAPTSASKPTFPTNAGRPTSPTGTSPPAPASKSSTSSTTTPASSSTSDPRPRSPDRWWSP